MAGEVPVWGSAVAKDVEESKKYDVVVSGGACLLQGAFAAVLAPVDGDLTGVASEEFMKESVKRRSNARFFDAITLLVNLAFC